MNADLSYALAVVAAGSLVAVACALPGTFLVLRRLSLVGDAISHAILPGLALGFALFHTRHSLVMLLGAACAGLLTVWLVETLARSRRVYEDSAVALVFPALFAMGVILMERFAHYVDLDPDCVIFGDIELVPFDTWSIAGHQLGPSALWVLGLVASANVALVLLCYKELKLGTFDPELGKTLGFSPGRLHYLLMAAVSLTTVAAFETVGAILVVAFLVVPAAAAYLLTDRLWKMLLIAPALGILSAVSGYAVAREEVLDCSVSGAMAAMAGVWFLAAWVCGPSRGLLAEATRRRRLRRRFESDLLLIHLRKVGSLAEAEGIAQRFRWQRTYGRRLIGDLSARGLVSLDGGRVTLTQAGEEAAEAIGRTHRPD
jgi:manganese/zinc/iron transport system permease protein